MLHHEILPGSGGAMGVGFEKKKQCFYKMVAASRRRGDSDDFANFDDFSAQFSKMLVRVGFAYPCL